MTTDIPDFVTPTFNPDNLGEDYSQHVIELGQDPDGEGFVHAVLVRYCPDSSSSDFQKRPAVLWIHGMSDYFFQKHVAERYHAEGYAFYAIDLRKCGRAHQPGQTWHGCSDLTNYFEDLNGALAVLDHAGHTTVTVNAHSTGGLIAVLWLDWLRSKGGHCPQAPNISVTAAVLNSPWLTLHVSRAKAPVYSMVTRVMSRIRPNSLIPVQSAGGYGKSISADHQGRWEYNLTFKPLAGHDKNWRWLNAIIVGQQRVSRGIDTGVPTLVLHSDNYLLGSDYTPELSRVDSVLNTEQIADATSHLGPQARNVAITGALHDVYLSAPEALDRAFNETFRFLAAVKPGDSSK